MNEAKADAGVHVTASTISMSMISVAAGHIRAVPQMQAARQMMQAIAANELRRGEHEAELEVYWPSRSPAGRFTAEPSPAHS
ncbi:hypothetical protein IWW34DRAFT_862287 [Fusarium oxysporum f. sp. albedinis]|nr:hypothetical protein IWW34DRAFT_862287 [Fusarium oxysporum f. sp. albedinis]